jgi:WhiB family redox-sensing transcriptional regulator
MKEYPPFDGSQVCAQIDPDLWFPTSEKQTGRLAKKLCHTCPWLESCLNYALNHEVVGIWGAKTERERIDMRKILKITAEPLYSDNSLATSLRGKVATSRYNDEISEVSNG